MYGGDKMRIKIYRGEVLLAKKKTVEFDRQKTYNKFVCTNNYIGYLAELVFDRYLTERKIEHQWVPFIKQWTNSPDFIINGVTIDLKCSGSGGLWVGSHLPHDIYISAQITPAEDYLYIDGHISGSSLYSLINNGHSRAMVRGNRTTHVIQTGQLLPIDTLMGVIYSSTPIGIIDRGVTSDY